MKNESIRKTINVDKPNYAPLWTFKQEDDAVLRLSLFKGSTSLDITGQTVKLGVLRADKTLVELEEQSNFTINKNELDITLKNNILSVSGKAECDLQLIDASGKMTTASFFIEVNKKATGITNILGTNLIEGLEKLKNEFKSTGDKLISAFSKEYDSLKRIIIDENQAANLQDQVNQTNAQLETKEHKMKFINVPNNSDLAEYFKNVDTIGTHRVAPGSGVTNVCTDLSSIYTFYYVYQTFVLGVTEGGRVFKAGFVNKTLGAWEEILTNKKISFKLTPKAGLTIAYQNCYAINNIVYINARVQMTDGSLFQPTSGNRELVTIPTKYCPTDATALQSWAASASTIGLPGASSAAAVPDGRVLAVNTGTPKTITVSGVYFI